MHELALESQHSPRTLAWAPFGLTACMALAEKEFGGTKWLPREEQRPFVDHVFPAAHALLARVPRTWIRSMASTDPEAINAFLREQGSGHVQQKSSANRGELLFAAVTLVLMKWSHPGERRTLRTPDGVIFAAASLEQGLEFLCAKGIETLVKIDCDEGCCAYLVPWQPDLRERIRDEVSLVSFCRELEADLRPTRPKWGSVQFPMIEMDFRADLSWMRGLSLSRGMLRHDVGVLDAWQEVGLLMNHIGARVRDEVVMSCLCISEELPPFVIDRPFLFWISHERLDGMPVFAAVLAQDAWKDPGDALD